MKRSLQYFILVVATIFIASCEQPSTAPEAPSVAQLLAERYLDAVHKGNYDSAFAMADPEYFGVRSEKDWKNYFSKVESRLGKFESMKLKQSLDDNRLTGTFHMYQFAAKYEKGLAKEMVTMIEKINTNEPLRIFAHRYESSKLMGIE